MIIKINDYYKDYIQHTRKNILREDYSLPKPYFLVILCTFSILCELLVISKYYNIITNILFIVPLAIGSTIELHKIKKYNKNNKNRQNTMNEILEIIFIRIFVIYLFSINSLLIISYASLPHYKNDNFIESNDFILIMVLLIFIPISIILFLIGYKMAKYELKVRKKIKYAPFLVSSSMGIISYNIYKNEKYSIIFILLIMSVTVLSYHLGKMYYKNKTYDKIVFPNDQLIDYDF